MDDLYDNTLHWRMGVLPCQLLKALRSTTLFGSDFFVPLEGSLAAPAV